MSKNKKDPRELFAEDARKRLQRIQAQKQQAATQQANAAAQQNTTAAASAATRQFLNPNNTFINGTAPATTAGAAPAAQNQDDAYVSYVQALMAARQNQRIPVAQQNALQRALSANMPTQYTPYAPGGVLGQGLDVYNRTNPATQRTMQGLSMQGYNLTQDQVKAILSGEAFIPEMSGWDYTWSKDGRTSIERSVGDSRNILSAATNAGWFDNDANLTPENIGLVSDKFLQGALNSEQYRLNEQLGESQYDNSEYLDYLRSLGGSANLSPANRSWASGIVTDNSRYNSIAQGNKGAGFAWAIANEVYNLYESNQEYYDLTGIDQGYPGVIEAYLDYTATRYDKDADDELMIANALALNHIISGGDLANYDEEQALAWYDSLEVEEQDELLAWALGAFSNRSLGYENVPWGQPEALGQLGGQYAGFDIWEGRRITNAEVRTQEIQTEVDRLQRAADERAELASIQSDLDAEILTAGYNITPEQLNAARDEVNTNYAEFLDNTGYGNLMTADELIRYTYLKAQDPSGEEADEYIELLKDQKLLEARSLANRAETTLYAEDPLFAVPTAVGSVAAGLGDIALAGGKAAESLTGNANPYSRWHDLSHYKGDVRFAQNAAIHEAIKEAGGNEGLADVAGMGYDVVMAGADMLPAMGVTALTKNPAAGAAVLGAESYSGAMTEAAMRGYDPALTQAYAIGTAAIEALTEKVSIEALLKNPTTLLGTIGRNFVTEGAEEIASGALNMALNTVADEIAGNETEFEALHRQLKAEGRENAFTDALAMTVGDLLYQGAVGGLTGGMMSTPGAVLNSVRNYSTGAQIVKNNAVDALLDEASAMGPGSEAAGMAEDIRRIWAEEAEKNAKKNIEAVAKAEAETEPETASETTSETVTPAETPETAPASRDVVEGADAPVEASRASEEATESAGEAAKAEAEEKKPGKVSKAKLGRLYHTLVRETQEQYGIRLNDTAVEIIANAIREQEAKGAQLDKRVGSAEIAQGMIDAVAKGGKLTGAMGRYIKSNPALKSVYEQYQKGIPQLQMRQMELTALHGAKLQKLQGMAAKPGSGKSGGTAGGATPTAKEYTDAAEEVRTETDEAVESLTRRKNPSDKHSKVITFATREGLSETGELKRVERHDDGLYLVVARDDEEVSMPVDSAEAYGGAKEADYTLKQVSAGGVARVIDYAHRHSEMTTEEINALVGLMESTAEKKVTSSQLIATYEAGVRAGYTGDAKPALETVARTPYGDKAVQALETALEMGHGMGVRQALADEKTRTEGISTRARGEGGVTFMGEVENTEDVEDTGKREAVETIMKDLSPQQNAAVRVLQSLSETSGIGITLFQTKAAHGEELHTPNGFYDPKTNSIFIDLQAGASRGGETMVESAILKTASHELTHYIEQNSQDGYVQLRTAAKKLLSERGKDYGKLITEKLNTLTHTNTRAQAEAEVIADACEMMLKDSTAAETMAKSNPGLWKTMTNWLKDFVTSFARRVKRAFSGITATSEEAQALTEIRDGVERYVGNIQKIWDNALVEATGRETAAETAEEKGGVAEERAYSERRKVDQTESPEFKRWFGNSEVTDRNGEAMVVYHTTRDSFHKFDRELLGSITDTNATDNFLAATAHIGFWFNTAPLTTKGLGKNAMAVFLKAERLYEAGTLDALANEIWDTYNQLGYDYDSEDPTIEQAREAGEVFRGWLEQRGYDGIAVEDTEFGGVSYVVFEPEQIKSATDNVGTFDPDNPDIRYSQRRGKPDLSVRDALMAITDFTGMTPAEESLLNRYQGNVLKLQEVTEAIAEKIAIRDNKETPEKERAEAKTEIWRLKRQKYAIERALIDAENEGGYAKLMTTAGEMVRLLTTKDSLPEVTQALQEQIAKVTEQLAAVQAELGEMSEEGMWNTINSLFDKRKLHAAAKRLKALYGSRISEKTLMNRIVLMQTTLLRGGENASAEYMRLGEELVRELRSKSRQDNEVLSILKEHIGTIELTETQRQEINNTIGMKEFLSVVRPVVKVVPKGKASVTLDVLLDEANAAEGGTNPLLPYFEGNMGEGDSIMRLYNLVKSAKTADTFVGRYGQEQLQAEMVDVMSIAAEASLVDAGAETVKTVMDALTKNAEGSDALTAKVRQLRVEMTKAGRAAGAAAWKADERHKAMGDVMEYLTALEAQDKLLADVDTKRKIERQVADESNKRIKEIIAERNVMERNRVMRERIRRTVGWMVTRIRRETDRKNVPEELKPYIEDAIRMFVDYNDVLRVFKKSEVAEIKRIFDALKKSDVKTEGTLNDLIAEELDGAFKELRVNLEEYGEAKTKGHKQKTMLSNQSLKAIDDIVEILWGQITKWNEVFIGGKQAQLSDVAERTVAGLNTKGDYAISDNVGGHLWEKVVEAARNKNLTPIYFFRLLQGNDVMQTLNDDVAKGQREYGVMLAGAKKKLEGIQAKYNYWAWKNADPLEFTTEQGRRTKDGKHDLSMTVDEAMSVWAIWKREEDTTTLFESTHLSNGGIVLQEGKRRVNGKLVQDNTPHKLSEADMAVIDKWLTAEQKAYAEAIVKYMSEEMAAVGNRASMRMFGIRKFKEEHYFPMRVQRDQLAHSSNKAAKNPEAIRIAGMSSALRRVERAWKPLAISSFTEVAANHINDMLLYGNFAVPIENFNTILNYNYTKNPSGESKTDEDASSMTVRALFRQKYGDSLTSYLETYLADLNGGTGVRENSKLMSLYKRSSVMASVAVAIQQKISIIRAWYVQNPKYYIKASSGKYAAPDHKEWEQLCKYSGEAVLKGIGGFDMTSTRNMGGYLAGTAEDTYSLAKKAGALVGVNVKGERLAGIKRQSDELMGLAAQKEDQIAWVYIWRATKYEVAAKNPGMDTNSEEFLRMAADRFGEVVNLTQVYDSTLVRSQNMRSKSNWTKALTAFMAEPTLTLNMLLDGWNRKDAKSIVKAAGIFMLSQLATAAVKSLWTAGRDDDEEKPWFEKYLAAVGGELGGYGGSLNPLNLIPYARDVMSALEGYDVERADITLVDQLIDELKKWADGKYSEDPAKGAKNTAFALSNLLGIPVKNIWRDVTTGINTWKDMTTDKRDVNVNVLQHEAVSNFLPWVDVSNDAYYTKLYQAMQKGDAEEVEALREFLGIQGKSEKTVNTGVKGVVKNLYKGQHMTDEEAKAFLLEHGLVKDEKEAFKAVDKWKEDGMYEGTEGEEKHNYSPYDTIYWGVDAMNGADIEEAIKELVDNGWTDKSVRQELRSHINELYREGSLTKAQARKLLTDHGGLDEDDVKDEDYWYWYFDKQDFAQGNDGSTDGYNKLEDLYAAVDAGSAAQYRTAMKELTTHGSTEKEVQSEVYSYLGAQYMDGEITASQLKSKAAKYAGKSELDQNDWYWEMKKWDFGKKNGGKTGDWAKFNDYYTAVESGKNLKAVTKEYLDHGVEASTLAGRITDKYKDEFVRLYKTNKTAAANLQNRILNAYEMLGYDRQKKLKDIAKWLEK